MKKLKTTIGLLFVIQFSNIAVGQCTDFSKVTMISAQGQPIIFPVGNPAYTLPYQGEVIGLKLEARKYPPSTASYVTFRVMKNGQVLPISSTSPNGINGNPMQSTLFNSSPNNMCEATINFRGVDFVGYNCFTVEEYCGRPVNGTPDYTYQFCGTINPPPPLVLTGPTFSGNPCQLGNNYIIVNASGGGGSQTHSYSFTYNNVPFGTSCINCPMFNTKGMGNYSVTVTSAGLSATKTFTVGQAECAALMATTSVVTNATCMANNGSAKVVATGGTGVYTYIWKNSAGQTLVPAQTTAIASGLPLGTYTCEVTSGTAIKQSTVTIPQTNTTLNVSITPKPRATGTGPRVVDNNTIEVKVNNAVPPANTYTYLWSTGATTPSIDLGYKMTQNNSNVAIIPRGGGTPQPPVVTPPAPKTTYTVTVTDANGCTGTASYQY